MAQKHEGNGELK